MSNKPLEWDFLLDFSHLAISHTYVVLGKMQLGLSCTHPGPITGSVLHWPVPEFLPKCPEPTLYNNKLDSLDDMNKFLEIYNVPKLNQEESENLNRQVIYNKIKAVIKKSKQLKALDQMASQVNFTKHSKNY